MKSTARDKRTLLWAALDRYALNKTGRMPPGTILSNVEGPSRGYSIFSLKLFLRFHFDI